ncbi:MAG: hypothetical protein F6J90_06410 [Moorea sp. SIOASIH]|uniref:hypothetical protein n=1 Tax=Moorena sp. SIOASIH TaxID=2607817 RepID=UPI0013BBF983|nr:hypothetical protein [Moorena sp. SIOASIH]NEO35979.1 hypothetical protein [Moorena sp. SIOASIH]
MERASCVEWASWWNGHLGGTGILVERASWWNGHLGGTGILVERASWWNGHLGGTGILPVINIFGRAGCPLYSYSFKD